MYDPTAKNSLRQYLGLPDLSLEQPEMVEVPEAMADIVEPPPPAPARPLSARPSRPAPLPDPAMDTAVAQDKDTSLLSNIGRATATLAGTGQDFWDAQKPTAVTGLRQRRTDDAAQRKTDPNSPRNQAFRKFVSTEGFAKGLAPEDIEMLTTDDWDYLGDTAKMKEAVEARKQAIQAQAEGRQATQNEINGRKSIDRMDRLGKATAAAPFGELERAFSTLEGIEPGVIYGNTPKKLKLDIIQRALAKDPTKILSNIMDPEAQRAYTAVSEIKDLISRMRTGAVINADEERQYLDILGARLFSSPEAFSAGLNQVRMSIGQRLKNLQIPFNSGGLLEEYGSQGGTTYMNPVFAGQGATPPPPAAPMAAPKASPPSLAPKLPTSKPVQDQGAAQLSIGAPEVNMEMDGEILPVPMSDVPLFESKGWKRH